MAYHKSALFNDIVDVKDGTVSCADNRLVLQDYNLEISTIDQCLVVKSCDNQTHSFLVTNCRENICLEIYNINSSRKHTYKCRMDYISKKDFVEL